MKKNISLFLFLLLTIGCMPAWAQQGSDSLWVKVLNNKWDVVHKVNAGETVFQIAKLYEAPPALLAQENGITFQTKLPAGSDLYIPIGPYNRISKAGVPGSKPLYYKTTSSDDWQRLAFLAMTSAEQIRNWNNLPLSGVKTGQVLLVGWVKYLPAAPTQPIVIRDTTPAVTAPDTVADAPIISREEEQFNLMTGDGKNAQSEKGAAIYFDSKTSGTTYYAFFNLAPRGTIIKIVNPGNGQYVFAKVIGAIPEQDRYQNALLGLSINAQKVLGGKGSRTWCEVLY